MSNNKKIALLLGVVSAFFFAFTFILNRLLSLNGNSWIWTAALRFYWMLPMFLCIVIFRGNYRSLIREIKSNLLSWIIWSTVGFGIFYSMLTYGAAYGTSWLIASTWQFTIIAGLIIGQFMNTSSKDSGKGIRSSALYSAIILVGIILMQFFQSGNITIRQILIGVLPVLIAAFAYPLGNRKIMAIANGRLDVYQRILGMLLCSMPFWIILTLYEVVHAKTLPDNQQLIQTLIVAISSGLIATALFFSATDRVRNDQKALAAIEATQSTEVIFAFAGEMLLLASPLPDIYALLGMSLVIIGMVLHSIHN